MFNRKLGLLLSLLMSCHASAHTFIAGRNLPDVFITDRGEIMLQQEKFYFQHWNSQMLRGQVSLLIHVAGRLSAKEQNSALIEAVRQADFPKENFRTTTIVNTDDAIPGSPIFVERSLKQSKKQAIREHFIIDGGSVAQHAWQLTRRGSAIVVLDSAGIIRFAKDGALTAEEVKQVITQLHQLTDRATAKQAPLP